MTIPQRKKYFCDFCFKYHEEVRSCHTCFHKGICTPNTNKVCNYNVVFGKGETCKEEGRMKLDGYFKCLRCGMIMKSIDCQNHEKGCSVSGGTNTKQKPKVKDYEQEKYNNIR